MRGFSRVVPHSLKGWGVYSYVCVTITQKRTCINHQNMSNDCTSTCLGCGTLGMYGCEGMSFKVTVLNVCLADLYAPQEVNLGEGSSSLYWCDTVQ